MSTRPSLRSPRAFTLIELIAVIVVLAILAGIAIPKYFDYAAQAKVSSVRGTLGGVRSAIANFTSNSAVNGAVAYPTLVQMQTLGTVMQEAIPQNPYNNDATIAAGVWAATPPTSGTNGWNYDAAAGRFWANSTSVGENLW
jgi:prepilin-type N-terminal cleavage/methylation domain-containing protein